MWAVLLSLLRKTKAKWPNCKIQCEIKKWIFVFRLPPNVYARGVSWPPPPKHTPWLLSHLTQGIVRISSGRFTNEAPFKRWHQHNCFCSWTILTGLSPPRNGPPWQCGFRHRWQRRRNGCRSFAGRRWTPTDWSLPPDHRSRSQPWRRHW